MFGKMTFHLKYIILICCLMPEKFVLGTENSFLTGSVSLDRGEITSMTNNFDRAKLRKDFSNLMLSDLNIRTGLPDESKFVKCDDEGDRDSGIDKKEQFYYNQENDLYLDDNVMQKDAVFARSNAESFNENTRAKREDSHKKRSLISEEYLKLLEDSFPQVSNQNEEAADDVSEDKKDHVRVKRVPPYY